MHSWEGLLKSCGAWRCIFLLFLLLLLICFGCYDTEYLRGNAVCNYLTLADCCLNGRPKTNGIFSHINLVVYENTHTSHSQSTILCPYWLKSDSDNCSAIKFKIFSCWQIKRHTACKHYVPVHTWLQKPKKACQDLKGNYLTWLTICHSMSMCSLGFSVKSTRSMLCLNTNLVTGQKLKALACCDYF